MYKNCGSASSGQPLSALVIPCWPLPARVPSPAPSELVDRQRLFLFLFLMSLKGITCIYWLASASASAKCCCVGEHLQRSAQRANFLQACQSCATKTHAAIAACAWCRPPPPPPARYTHTRARTFTKELVHGRGSTIKRQDGTQVNALHMLELGAATATKPAGKGEQDVVARAGRGADRRPLGCGGRTWRG